MSYVNNHINIPIGQGGLNKNPNFYDIPLSALVEAKNIVFRNSTIVKSFGLSNFDANPIGSVDCYGGIDWRPDTANQYQVTAWSNGSVYRSDSSNIDATTLASGLTFTDPVIFVNGGFENDTSSRKLLMFSKDVRPQQVEGTGSSFSNLTNDSSDWSSNYPGAATYHDSRVIAYDFDPQPHNIYISSLDDHADFSLASGSTVYRVAPGVGERITCVVSGPQQLFYVFKTYGIYEVNSTDMNGYGLPQAKLRDDVGCAGPRAAIRVDNDILFISPTGRLYSLTALANPSVPLSQADITQSLQLDTYIRDNVDLSRIQWAQLHYNEGTKELFYFYTTNDSVGGLNDGVLVFNLEIPGNPRVSTLEYGEYFNAAWTYKTNAANYSMYVAGEEGQIYDAFSENRNVEGAAYESEFSLAPTDLGMVDSTYSSMRKRFDYLQIYARTTGDYDLNVTFTADEENSRTEQISLDAGNALFDSAVFDSAEFASDSILKRVVPVDAYCDTLRIAFTHDGLNQNFQIIAAKLFFRVRGTDYENAG